MIASGPRGVEYILQDEIDALASSRSGSESNGSHEGVLTSLLNEMDGVQELLGVTVVAATNRPDVIVRLAFRMFKHLLTSIVAGLRADATRAAGSYFIRRSS